MELSETKRSECDYRRTIQPLMAQVSPSPNSFNTAGRSRFNLYLACVTANISWFASGTCTTWTSPTLPQLLVPNDVLVVTQEQSAWIGSLFALGVVFGPFVAGALVNHLGRKWTITLSVVCITLGWLILLFARNLDLIYLARIIAGIGAGITYTAGPMYIGELAEDEVREALGSCLSFFLFAGFLLEYLVGPYVSYSVLIIASLVPPVIFLLMFSVFMPESPYYLLQKRKDLEAFKALSWLRKGVSTDDVRGEINLMKASVEASLRDSGSFRDLFSTVGNRKALLLSCGLIIGQQFSGASVIVYYAESIFLTAHTGISPSLSSIIVGVILILMSGTATPLVRRFGIKWLLVFSAVGLGVSQGLLGLYFYLHRQQVDLSSLNWLPIASLVCFISMFAIGFGPLPWAFMAEVFPSNVKAYGSAISASCCGIVSFITTKFFINISYTYGEYFSFWIFMVFCILMLLFTVFLLPDTRGMSLEEIQDVLNNRQKGRS